MGDEINFSPADKHESFLQNNSVTLGLHSHVCPKYPKQVCNISRKTWRMRLIFCLQINVKGLFKVILLFWMFVARHAQITQNNKYANSLKYHKKEVILWFWWRWPSIPKHSQSSPNSKFAMFLQYLKSQKRN